MMFMPFFMALAIAPFFPVAAVAIGGLTFFSGITLVVLAVLSEYGRVPR